MSNLQRLNEHAAAIDVGSESLHTSIAGGTPKVFGTMTVDLYALRDYLMANGATSVAMEATGVYWLCLYEVLHLAGLEVIMVNGRHVKNLPGRKTDMADCQWLATLHAHGLLRAGFVPEAMVRRLQDYMRLRNDHISLAASHVQHMQKALDRMNIKVHEVISSLTGVSGLAMLRAMVAGERDPQTLLNLCDVQIRKRKAERLLASLEGTWRDEHVFALKQALTAWDFYQVCILECDVQIEQVMQVLSQASTRADADDSVGPDGEDQSSSTIKPSKVGKAASANAPKIPGLHEMIVKTLRGHDASVIPGLTDYSILQLTSEVGCDLSLWPSAKHFTSWLGLAPGANQSGKRRGHSARQRNRAGRLFCTVARSLANSADKGLGGFYRRMRARRGGLIANQALARKLATMYWNVMVKGLHFVEKGVAHYEAKVEQNEQHLLRKLASKHNLKLVPNPHPA
jgi:transposase